MAYVTEHADALAAIADAGAAVTFTLTTSSTDPLTGESAAATPSTVSGSAIRVKGNPEQYQQLGLIEARAPTLLFVGSTKSETVPLGSTGVWAGESGTVRAVSPLDLDGTGPVLARVVLEQGASR